MKKVVAIIGAISGIIGFVLFLSAQMEISSNSYYTWTSPYTPYEAKIILIKIIGIVLLLCGVIDLIIWIVSKVYSQKTETDPTNIKISSKTCPKCGLYVQKTTQTCPKCGSKIL